MTQTAKEYADALFSLGLESDQVGDFCDGLTLMDEALRENPAYVRLLCSPNIPARQRKQLLREAFGESVPAAVLSFAELLCEKGHMALFDVCFREYLQSVQTMRRLCCARIVSAVPLSDAERSTLEQKLAVMAGKSVQCEYRVDAAILGGLIVYMNDTVIDGSLRRKLQSIKEELSQ